MAYVLLLVGFALLIKGADYFVEGASSIARNLQVPSIVIGLTLVSLGTSAPEAAVSITAGLQGSTDMALGNVIGSNMFNLLAVIGCAAVFHLIQSPNDIIRRDLPINITISILLLLFMYDGRIGRLDGLVLFIGIILYMIYIVQKAMKNRVEISSKEDILPIPQSILYVVLGLAAVVIGGQLVVNNASSIALSLGMSDTLVGLTIVAIGTSLPELVTSVMAARKGDAGIALGNAVGSSIFNILFILGTASMITPIHADPSLFVDVILLILVSIVIWIFSRTGRVINHLEGVLCILAYIGYSIFIILRGLGAA